MQGRWPVGMKATAFLSRAGPVHMTSVLGPRAVLDAQIASVSSRGPLPERLAAQSPWPCGQDSVFGPRPAESLAHASLERYRQHFVLFSMRFLDHGLSSGTFCKRMFCL